MSEILVLGGDGFCGWPTALHLAAHEDNRVTIVDNLSRRRIDDELGAESLTPISTMQTRLEAWEEIAGKERAIGFAEIDIANDYYGILDLINRHGPDAIVHFAEQRSAPYSMKNPETAIYTSDNNEAGTTRVLTAIANSESKPHLVHLGTMGVYGYGHLGKTPIPEGYQEVTVPTDEGPKQSEILYPADPGSIYHMTKVVDQAKFAAYAKFYGLRITDLHQGIVWGTQTDQTKMDQRLINRFDYDGDYGTVLNRFLMQAAIKHPLTVYGTGGQTRAFINIQDTVRCIELAIKNPPEEGDRVAIHNQVTETYRVSELAELISGLTGVAIEYLPNPRAEAAENDLVVRHEHLEGFGLEPTTLADGLLEEVIQVARKYAHRADKSVIPPSSYWNGEVPAAKQLGDKVAGAV